MLSLFIDTTNGLEIGLLDEKLQWLDFHNSSEKKSSSLIHPLIYKMVKSNNTTIKNVKNLFISSGPGSYTGIRVAEGIAQIFGWNSINIFSYYNFDIPKIIGLEEGTWISNAFKQEIYVYKWDKKSENKRLIHKDELTNLINNYDVIYQASENTKIDCGEFRVEYVSQMIKAKSEQVFQYIKDNQIRKKAFYYRDLEKEFKVSKR